jgi:hypothetical protein
VSGVQRSERDLSDLLRSVGGLLFAAGAVVLVVRKSGHHGWGDFARVAVVFVPTVVLYLLALRTSPRERARPWQSVLILTATLLTPVVLFEFLHWVGANTRHLLYDAGVFALTGLLAGYAARRGRVAYAGLLSALALLAAWLLLWGKILNHPSANTFRWVLVASAALLLLAAARLARAGALAAAETAVAGGIAAVAAGLLGVIVGAFVGATQVITGSTSIASGQSSSGRLLAPPGSVGPSRLPPEPLPTRPHLAVHTNGLQHPGWDIYLLIVSLALVWLGSRVRARGIGYVGAIGLGAFIISVGVQITRLQAGRGPTHDVLVWPLALVILGAGALCVSLVRRPTP